MPGIQRNEFIRPNQPTVSSVGSSRQGCESRRVKVPPPSVAQNGRLAYPLLGEVTDRKKRGPKKGKKGKKGSDPILDAHIYIIYFFLLCPQLDCNPSLMYGIFRSQLKRFGRGCKLRLCLS